MADLPETSEFTEGVRAFESTDPARYDVLNNALQPLVNRTKWLKDNMSQGGGGGSAPVDWLETAPEESYAYPIEGLQEGTMYILDVRNGGYIEIYVNPTDVEDIPVGSEYHFVCAGDPEHVMIVDFTDGSPQE